MAAGRSKRGTESGPSGYGAEGTDDIQWPGPVAGPGGGGNGEPTTTDPSSDPVRGRPGAPGVPALRGWVHSWVGPDCGRVRRRRQRRLPSPWSFPHGGTTGAVGQAV